MRICPFLAVDAIINFVGKIVLIKRKNPPFGWALPGGFVELNESLEDAVVREIKEETTLDLVNLKQFKCYSDPKRDPRMHVISCVFTASGVGLPQASDDAKEIALFDLNNLPELAFDHAKILEDYKSRLNIEGYRYYVNNPSAWISFNQEASDIIQRLLEKI